MMLERPKQEQAGSVMIISHRHRFVFVKTGKTAGSTIEIALSRICAPGDLLTPMVLEESLRRDVDLKPAARTFQSKADGHVLTLKNHSPYSAALRIFGEQIVDYDVISVERNPWEKAISSYFWKGAGKLGNTSPDRFRRFVMNNRAPRGFGIYALYDVPVVDIMLRTEHLREDIDLLRSAKSLPDTLSIDGVRAKGSRRPDEAVREKMFQRPETVEHIRNQFSQELEYLAYTFEAKGCGPAKIDDRRRDVRQRFLQDNPCGPDHWQQIGD